MENDEEDEVITTSTKKRSRKNSLAAHTLFIRDRLTVGVSLGLISLAMLGWIASYYLMPLMMNLQPNAMRFAGVASIVSSSSLSISSIGLFELVWIVGMVAMMFPAMMPIVLFYNKISTKLEPNPRLARLIGTPIFLGGYLITYAILGLVAYLSIYVALNISTIFSPATLAIIALVAPGVVLFLTGLYQFTKLKSKCLSSCISPIGFFATRSRKGFSGSFEMGFSHGGYCVGCCWAYMIVMLAVGAMSIPVMAILAGVIALEKILMKGSVWFNRIVAAGFIFAGIIVTLFPGILLLI